MKRTPWLIFLMLVLTLSWTTAGFADDSWKTVQGKNKLVVGFCAHYPPFESRNLKTNALEGFDVDLGRALAHELGVDATFVDAEWQGLLGGLQKGDFDVLITCMSKSEARASNVNMSDVYYELPDVIVVNQTNSDIRAKADLKGKTVGVQLGSGSEQIIDRMGDTFKDVKKYNYNPEAFTDLKFNRIDAIVVGYAYAVNQIKTTPGFKVVGEPLAKAEIVMVMKKGSDALTHRLNTALATLRANTVYDAIQTKWLEIN